MPVLIRLKCWPISFRNPSLFIFQSSPLSLEGEGEKSALLKLKQLVRPPPLPLLRRVQRRLIHDFERNVLLLRAAFAVFVLRR